MSLNELVPFLEDKDFLFSLFALNDPSGLEEAFSKKGKTLTLEEQEELWDVIVACKAELKNESFEKASGGSDYLKIMKVVKDAAAKTDSIKPLLP